MAKTSPNGLENGYQLPFERPVIQLQRQILELEAKQEENGRNYASEIQGLRDQWVSLLRNIYNNLTPWETVLVSRHPSRPLGKDYLDHVVKDFVEIHGDRRFGDDKAIRCGMGHIGTEKVMMVVQHKGRDTKEKITCNFGMPQPEGYRKALRAMKMAEKFRLPVVTLIDTPGAFPGVGSEERGVAEAIARNLLEMSRLKTPIVCVVIGEGGSGGALGIGVGDCIAMMQYAYYSVISPEGCASILWRTGEKAPEAAAALKLTAPTLKELRVIDDIVPEPLGGAHRRPSDASYNLERYLVQTLRKLARKPIDELLQTRYERWRSQGEVIHVSPTEAPGA